MEAAGLGVNGGEGLPRITTPTAQIERLRAQPHLNTTGVSASPIDTRAALLGKARMTVGFTQPRVEPDVRSGGTAKVLDQHAYQSGEKPHDGTQNGGHRTAPL